MPSRTRSASTWRRDRPERIEHSNGGRCGCDNVDIDHLAGDLGVESVAFSSEPGQDGGGVTGLARLTDERPARTVADPAVRHRGTFGGSLAHGDPAGDLPAVALAYGAEMVIEGAGGRRTVPAADFFRDYLQTAVGPDEVLVEVRLPKLGPGWGHHYEKFHRTAQAWALVGVAALVHRSNGSISEARVGLTNMGSTALRATATESALAGVDASAAAVAGAAAHAADGTSPSADLHAGADYREHLARVLTRRAVSAAAGV